MPARAPLDDAETVSGFLNRHPEFMPVFEFAGPPAFVDAAAKTAALEPELARLRLFEGLVVPVVHQQLSGKVARVIEARLHQACAGGITGEALLGLGENGLRALGLSSAKTRALLGLADEVVSGRLDVYALTELDDEALTTRLCELWGFGPWSAHMFLLFTLGRMDIWAPADLGVRKGYAKLYGLAEVPGIKELESQRERYSPNSSIATWYFWRVLES